MAKSVNKVILLGNVGKDPEIKSTPSGTMVATFGLATSDRYQDPQGNWQDRTDWHNLVAFKRTAEIIRDYVKKGSKLYVEGSLRTSNWEDKTSGQKRTKLRVVGENFQLLGPRPGGAASGAGEEEYTERPPQRRESPSQSGGGFSSGRTPAQQPPLEDDDIPF